MIGAIYKIQTPGFVAFMAFLSSLSAPAHSPCLEVGFDADVLQEVLLREQRAVATEERVKSVVIQQNVSPTQQVFASPESSVFAPIPASLALPDPQKIKDEALAAEKALQTVLLGRLAATNPKSAAIVASGLQNRLLQSASGDLQHGKTHALKSVHDAYKTLDGDIHQSDSTRMITNTVSAANTLDNTYLTAANLPKSSNAADINSVSLSNRTLLRTNIVDPLAPSQFRRVSRPFEPNSAPVPRLGSLESTGLSKREVNDILDISSPISGWKNPRGRIFSVETRVSSGSGFSFRGGIAPSQRLADLTEALLNAERQFLQSETSSNAEQVSYASDYANTANLSNALGQSNDAPVFDRELFDRSATIASGYVPDADERVPIYDTPIFGTAESSHIIHRPQLGNQLKSDEHRPPTSNPVQFEKDSL